MSRQRIPKYPYKQVKPAEPPTESEWVSMNREDIASGPGKPRLTPPKKFLDHEKKTAITESPPYRVKPPRWVLARIARHVKVSVVCNDLITRLRRAPSKRAYIETQQGFNEIGRRRGGGKLLRSIITQELVDEFIERGEE